MARTQTQAAKMTRSRARFWSVRVIAVVPLSAATAFAQDDKPATQGPKSTAGDASHSPTKGDASDAASKGEKGSAKGEHSSKGEKSVGH